MQVVKLDMTNSSHQCPPGTRERSDLPKRLCGNKLTRRGCSSAIMDVHGIKYRKVCGKIIAYQDASPDAFGGNNTITRSHNIDGNYILMASALLMATIHESIFGALQEH